MAENRQGLEGELVLSLSIKQLDRKLRNNSINFVLG